MSIKKPCNDCPWRKDAPLKKWDDQHFVDIYRNCQGDGHEVMLCHKAKKPDGSLNADLYCRGWLAVVGFESIGIRLLSIKGKVDAADILAASRKGLYATFDAMMKANRIPLPAVETHADRIRKFLESQKAGENKVDIQEQ